MKLLTKTINFTVSRGHQVASGFANDQRFVGGTIAQQMPYFKKLGLNLSPFYLGTINARFDCEEVLLTRWDYQFEQVKWHAEMPEEDFRFCHCQIIANKQIYNGLIYQPQAITKTQHFQDKNTLEILAPFVEGLSYNCRLSITIAENTLKFIR
jgi:hypothetical protein